MGKNRIVEETWGPFECADVQLSVPQQPESSHDLPKTPFLAARRKEPLERIPENFS